MMALPCAVLTPNRLKPPGAVASALGVLRNSRSRSNRARSAMRSRAARRGASTLSNCARRLLNCSLACASRPMRSPMPVPSARFNQARVLRRPAANCCSQAWRLPARNASGSSPPDSGSITLSTARLLLLAIKNSSLPMRPPSTSGSTWRSTASAHKCRIRLVLPVPGGPCTAVRLEPQKCSAAARWLGIRPGPGKSARCGASPATCARPVRYAPSGESTFHSAPPSPLRSALISRCRCHVVLACVPSTTMPTAYT